MVQFTGAGSDMVSKDVLEESSLGEPRVPTSIQLSILGAGEGVLTVQAWQCPLQVC